MARRTLLGLVAFLLAATTYRLDAQVTYDRILRAASEPQNWLTYGGTYFSQRFSGLRQIDPTNAKNLETKWMYQAPGSSTATKMSGPPRLAQKH